MLASAAALSGCADEKPGAVGTRTVPRYCELSRQLAESATGSGAAPVPGAFGGSAEAVQRLLAQMGGAIGELKSTAPKEVRGEVSTLIDALEKGGRGDVQALRSAKVTEATGKINAFQARSCPPPGSSDDG